MAEITKELGRIPVSRGDYQTTVEYYKDNIVQYKRGSYQVVSESPIVGIPPTNDNNVVNPGWTLFAGTLDAQDVVNQIKEQETKSIQAVAEREAEILAKSDAAEVSFDNTGTSLSRTNVQDALKETDGKITELESNVVDLTHNVGEWVGDVKTEVIEWQYPNKYISADDVVVGTKFDNIDAFLKNSTSGNNVSYLECKEGDRFLINQTYGLVSYIIVNVRGYVSYVDSTDGDGPIDIVVPSEGSYIVIQGKLNSYKYVEETISERIVSSPKTEDSQEEGLVFTDVNGNVVGGFKDGKVFAKNPVPFIQGGKNSLNIADEKGNIIACFENGNIVTNGFNGKLVKLDIERLRRFAKLIFERVCTLEENNHSDELVRDVPENRGVLNAYKKARQIEGLKWMELSDSHDLYPSTSGYPRERHGVPYSEVLNVDKFVGFNTSIRAFITAANNPYSLLYTEDLRKPNPTSGYGLSYNNYDGGTYIGNYFGLVCNTFVAYCIGLKCNYYTMTMEWMSKNGILEKVYDQTPQGLKLMDLIWEPGHVVIVTDIYRDSRGQVKKIFISEQDGHVRTQEYTPETLIARKEEKGGGIIYRFNDLYKNLEYNPTEFCPVEDEEQTAITFNNDICTYAGDTASFKVGEPVWINYNLKSVGSWNAIELYKGDNLVGTYAIDSSVHRYQLPSNLTYGKYKARMKNETSYSDYTTFEIIEGNLSYEKIGEEHKFTFSSNNGNAEWLSVCTSNGRHKAVYKLTDTDKKNGFAIFNIKELSLAQGLTRDNDIDSMELYAKVYFYGEYGNVTNQLLKINL